MRQIFFLQFGRSTFIAQLLSTRAAEDGEFDYFLILSFFLIYFDNCRSDPKESSAFRTH